MPKKFVDPIGQPHEFPEAILNSINENCRGGFLLFFINSQGEIEPRANFDDEISEQGLLMWSLRYLKSISKSYDIDAIQGIFNSLGDSESEEEED